MKSVRIRSSSGPYSIRMLFYPVEFHLFFIAFFLIGIASSQTDGYYSTAKLPEESKSDTGRYGRVKIPKNEHLVFHIQSLCVSITNNQINMKITTLRMLNCLMLIIYLHFVIIEN